MSAIELDDAADIRSQLEVTPYIKACIYLVVHPEAFRFSSYGEKFSLMTCKRLKFGTLFKEMANVKRFYPLLPHGTCSLRSCTSRLGG